MELQILVSQKGTRVITATNLYRVLGLPDSQYAGNLKKWMNDVYNFRDGIRKPIALQDFAKRPLENNGILKDFYLCLEFAKLITLKTNSKVKLKYAQWLQHQDEAFRKDDLINAEEVAAAIELAKSMRHSAYQASCERQHHEVYKHRNGGSAANWWRHREQVTGFQSDDIRQKAALMGISDKQKQTKDLLKQIDPLEFIRIGTIDLYMALGKNMEYAQKMGDLTKLMAQKLQLTLIEDKKPAQALTPVVNSHLLQKVLEMEGRKVAKRA